jgi:hypothetical protein
VITAARFGVLPMRRCAAQALVLVGLIGGGEAQAAEPETPEAVRLRYSATEECPSEAAFSGEVKARIRKPVTWTAALPARDITVTIQVANDRARGDLDIVETNGERTARSIAADTCAEVASGLALVVALALDPNARTEPLAQSAAPPPPPVAPPPPAPKVEPPRPVRERPLRVFAGLAGGVGSGYAPVANIVAGALLGTRLETDSAFAPSLYLTPSWGKTGVTGPEAAEAEFSWFLVRIDACPVRFRASTSLAFWGCASAELGNVNAIGKAIANPDEQDRLWADLGPGLRGRLALGSWFLDVGGGLLFTLRQYRFFFAPDSPESTVHQTGPVVFGGTLALGGEL